MFFMLCDFTNFRKVTVLFFVSILVFLPLKSVYAYNIDYSDTANFNLRIDGPSASNGISSVVVGDIDGNNINDIVVGSSEQDNNSRANSGSVYIILDSIISALGSGQNSIDLSDNTNYSIRLDGAEASTFFGYTIKLLDIDHDTMLDLVVSAPFASNNGRGQSGSIYVIKDSILRSHSSGYGDNVDLGVSSNYSFRIDGAETSTQLGYQSFSVGDINGNGKNDLLLGAPYVQYHGDEFVGGVYLVSDSILDLYTSIGQNIDLNDTNNYNLRIKRGSANDSVSYENGVEMVDINNDGNLDIILAAKQANFNSRTNSGSLYVIYNNIVAPYITTKGNLLDLSLSSSYNLRFDGAISDGSLGYGGFSVVNIDDNNFKDILVGAPFSSLSCSNCGSLYFISDSIYSNKSGTGNNIDLNNNSSYNLRIDGSVPTSYFGWGVKSLDYNLDGKIDIFVSAPASDNNGRENSGSIFGIGNSTISQYSDTGNTLSIPASGNYLWRYDGAVAGDQLSYQGRMFFEDYDGTGSGDILSISPSANNNSKIGSGSVYISNNFPHSIEINDLPNQITDTLQLSGTVLAPLSVTNISAVQYSLNSNDPLGEWVDCVASDGNFDSLNELYLCDISGLVSDSYVVYIRAKDSLLRYTASSNYAIGNFNTTSSAVVENGLTNNSINNQDNHTCQLSVPEGGAELFQINMTSTTATLYYRPSRNDVSGYSILYGHKEGDRRFGVTYDQLPTNGVQSYVIRDLLPNTNYAFEITPRNMCAAGTSTKWLAGKTTKKGSKKVQSFYLYH